MEFLITDISEILKYYRILDSVEILHVLVLLMTVITIISLVIVLVFIVSKLSYYRKKSFYRLTVVKRGQNYQYELFLSKHDVVNVKVYKQHPQRDVMKLIVADILVVNDVDDYMLTKLPYDDNHRNLEQIKDKW